MHQTVKPHHITQLLMMIVKRKFWNTPRRHWLPKTPPFLKNQVTTKFILEKQRFDELRKFREINGHCLVPRQYENNKALGMWVSMQRRRYKLKLQGKGSTLADDHVSMLNSIGFVWDAPTWEQQFGELKKFHDINGHCVVPQQYNVALGSWVSTQRKQYKLKLQGKGSSTLIDARASMLNRVGFLWDEAYRSTNYNDCQTQISPYSSSSSAPNNSISSQETSQNEIDTDTSVDSTTLVAALIRLVEYGPG